MPCLRLISQSKKSKCTRFYNIISYTFLIIILIIITLNPHSVNHYKQQIFNAINNKGDSNNSSGGGSIDSAGRWSKV